MDQQKEDTGDYTLTVRSVRKETEDATTIVFESPESKIKYKPGQFLTILFPVGDQTIRRSYSFCSSPYHEEDLAITIKKIKGGTVSNIIPDTLKPGDVVEVMEPMGNFTIEINPAKKRKIIVFAGGSGITPLMSIVKSILFSESESEVLLVYQNRNKESIIFQDELKELQSTYPGRLNIEHILSKPGVDWKGRKGRISAEMIYEIIEEEENIGESEIFICGPQGMMETVENALEKQGIEKHQIRKESFVSKSSPKAENASGHGSEIITREVTVIHEDEEYQYNVEPDSTILDSGLDQDIDLPFSCQSGMCTACRGKLLSGEVYMEDADGLSDEELKEGYILPCVSHPLTDDVKVEIG